MTTLSLVRGWSAVQCSAVQCSAAGAGGFHHSDKTSGGAEVQGGGGEDSEVP